MQTLTEETDVLTEKDLFEFDHLLVKAHFSCFFPTASFSSSKQPLRTQPAALLQSGTHTNRPKHIQFDRQVSPKHTTKKKQRTPGNCNPRSLDKHCNIICRWCVASTKSTDPNKQIDKEGLQQTQVVVTATNKRTPTYCVHVTPLQQQRKMTGSAMGGAGAARDHRGSHRAAMIQTPPSSSQLMSGPQSAYAAANQPLPPPPGSYLGMNVNLGLTMTMSDMESSIRAYHPSASQHPQQQHHAVSPSTHTDAGGSFWRPQQMDPAGAYGGKAHGGLELELGDILGTGGSSNDSDRDGMRPEGASPDVTMSVMGSSFEVSPFGDHMNIGGSGVGMMKAGGGYAHSHALLRQQEQQHNARGGSIGEHQDLLGRPSTTRSISSSSSAGGVPTNPNPNNTTPTSATEGSNTSEYSRFVDSRDEPDLSQHKIDEKNEKCQFHNCPNRARVSQAYGKFCNRHVIVAPCGFPGCRDKALLNSSMCDKHLAQGKDALHKILASRAQNVPVCRTFGCFKNDQGRGYCRGHEKLLMATGRLPKHINKRRLNSAYTMCSYPGCNKHSQRNHLCRTHGNLITKQAEELCSRSAAQGGSETYEEILSRLQKDIRKCTHPSCTKNSQRDRLCTMHYYEKHNLQRDGGGGSSSNSSGGDQPHTSSNSSGPSEVPVPVCSIPDCNLQALGGAKGMCKYHSGGQGLKSPMSDGSGASSGMMIRDAERTRCNVPGCVQAAYTSGICVQHLKQQQTQQQQTQQQQPHMLASGSRYNNNNNVLSFGGDGRFSPASMGDPTNPRASMDSFYAGGGAQGASAANAYANALDATMNSYAAMSTGGRHVPSGGAPGSSDVENEAKQALVSLNTGKPGENRSYVNSSGSRSTKCANPICTRESYGRELCESCQSMFSPLVVSVGGGDSLGSSGGTGTSYPFSVGGGASAQPEPETSPHGWGEGGVKDASSLGKASQGASTKATSCRVQQCNKAISQGGLCETHLRLFQNGTLSVDEITLPSRQSKAPASEIATAAPKPSVASASTTTNLSGGKMKKYFCKTEGCDKQAQRRGLCKRHFRLQENNAASSSVQPNTGGSSSMDFAMTSNQQQSGSGAPCRFPGCIQSAATGALCSLHANASFCWQPGCENIVNGPQFCEFHAYRKQCAYEGCNYSTKDATSSGCATHAMERRCSHAHCDKFAVSDRCRLHQISCHEEPCALCELHGRSGMDDDDEAELQQQVHPQRTGGGGQRMKENQFAQGNANNEFGAASNAKGNAMFRESRLI